MPDAESRERLRRVFRRFAEAEAIPQGSPLYAHLCEVIALDERLLEVAAEARRGQPVPNLFFGAVHAALAGDPDHDLARYYASLGGTAAVDGGLDERREEIVHLLRSRIVQTNEVRRSAVLLPAFAEIAGGEDGRSLALIEVGASAGLNLLPDRYAYRYSGAPAGDAESPLVLETEVRVGAPPVARVPLVASRLGLELNALDLRSEADMRWLRALVWPEHEERRRVLSAAIEIARRDPPEVRTADVFEALPEAIATAPPESEVVVYATFVLNQFTSEMRERLRTVLLDASRHRVVHVVVVGFTEWFGGPPRDFAAAAIDLARLRGGRGEVRPLGSCDPHGWWIDWQPGDWREW